MSSTWAQWPNPINGSLPPGRCPNWKISFRFLVWWQPKIWCCLSFLLMMTGTDRKGESSKLQRAHENRIACMRPFQHWTSGRGAWYTDKVSRLCGHCFHVGLWTFQTTLTTGLARKIRTCCQFNSKPTCRSLGSLSIRWCCWCPARILITTQNWTYEFHFKIINRPLFYMGVMFAECLGVKC